MKLKRTGVIALAIILVISVLAGCGGGSGSGGANVPSESGSGANSAVFYLSEGEAYTTIHFDDDSRIEKPADPTAEGKSFTGWFTADGEEFSDMKKYSGDQSFYAGWQTGFALEAEATQLTGLDLNRDDANSDGNKIGYGRSGEAPGTGMIADRNDASGGKYIRGLYYYGANLEFIFTSDAAVDDATLVARLSAEFKDYALTSSDLVFEVNGQAVPYNTTINLTEDGPFTDFTISTAVSLREGENVIRLVVENDEKQFPDGTVYAAAPIVDCLYVYTTSELSMTTFN